MRRYLVPVLVVLFLGGMLSAAYALSQPPSKEILIASMENMKTYQFVRESEFDQYRIYVTSDNVLKKEFLYHGKGTTWGRVDLRKGIVEVRDELYINGTLAMRTDAIFDLRNERVSGTVTLADGTVMDVSDFFERYYGIDRKKSIEMLEETLPALILTNVLKNSGSLREVKGSLSLLDRILMGLGLKEKIFEYEFTTKSGKEWHMFVDSSGRPVKFVLEDRDVRVTIQIVPEE